MTHDSGLGFNLGQRPFFGHNIAFEATICFILREKNRKKFENLLTHANGWFIVNISKGTGALQVARCATLWMMPFALNQVQTGQSKPELSGGKQDDLIPLRRRKSALPEHAGRGGRRLREVR
jgi:hypothetical protein